MYEQYQNFMLQIEDSNHDMESDESEKKMQPDSDGLADELSKEMVEMEVGSGFSIENGKVNED